MCNYYSFTSDNAQANAYLRTFNYDIVDTSDDVLILNLARKILSEVKPEIAEYIFIYQHDITNGDNDDYICITNLKK
jgi:hypothetical protein